MLQDGVLQAWASRQKGFIPLLFLSLSLMLTAGSGRWWLSQRLPSCQFGSQIIPWKMELSVPLLLTSSRCEFLGGTFPKSVLWIYFDLSTACTTNSSPLQVKGGSHRDLLVHFNVMEGNRNLEEDYSGTKVPWTELPEPRHLFICNRVEFLVLNQDYQGTDKGNLQTCPFLFLFRYILFST